MPERDPRRAVPEVEIVYRRLPDEVTRFRQELLFDGPHCKISLLVHPPDADPLRVGEVTLAGGGALLWYLFPGRPYEVAAVYDRSGRFLGWYTNLLRPPEIHGDRWELTDLWLDVWQPAGDGPARILDRDDLAAALRAGHVEPDEARRVEGEAEAVRRATRAGRWPPKVVRRHPLEAVGSLRLRRDEPGRYFANLVIGRLIAAGMYVFGFTSLVSLAFAAGTDAFSGPGPALTAWKVLIAGAAAAAVPLALAGRLPATRHIRPQEALSERILFIGCVVTALAVFLYPDSRLWRASLVAIYAILAAFCAIFAVARIRWDRTRPVLAVAGLLVSLFALVVLLV
ncbi:MAG: DUF402 domain-containing protein [Gemmatimonadota bacterium]|nr:DUF402 domain-containing protein [Gemmatimonadota bacterium]